MNLSAQDALDLLAKCEHYIPNLEWKWQEKSSICIGRIPDNSFRVKVFTTNEDVNITLGVERDNDKVIDFIHLHGKIVEISTLFDNFYSELNKLDRQLTCILRDTPNRKPIYLLSDVPGDD